MKRLRKQNFAWCCLLLLAVVLTACGKPTVGAVYQLEIEGSLKQAGVIDYCGLEMNVYQDAAANPCGNCPDQPISVFVGATGDEVAKAMAKAIARADDIWQVKKCSGNTLVLEERLVGQGGKPVQPVAPAGLSFTEEYIAAH